MDRLFLLHQQNNHFLDLVAGPAVDLIQCHSCEFDSPCFVVASLYMRSGNFFTSVPAHLEKDLGNIFIPREAAN